MHFLTLKTKIILLIIMLLTALSTLFAALYNPKQSQSILKPMIRIAAFLPLSGNNEHIGLAAKQAMEKTLLQTNPANKYKYDVFFLDNLKQEPLPENTAAILAFNFAPEPRVNINIIGSADTNFTVHSKFQDILNLLSQELERKSIKNIGLIILSQGEYQTFANMFNSTFKEKYQVNGAVFKEGQTDFTPILNQLLNRDTDYFVILGTPKETDLIMGELNRYGITNEHISTLYGIDLTASPQLYNNTLNIGSAGGTFDGGLSAAALLALMEAYEENFDSEKQPSPDAVSEYIWKSKAPDNNINIEAVVKEVSGGKINKITEKKE